MGFIGDKIRYFRDRMHHDPTAPPSRKKRVFAVVVIVLVILVLLFLIARNSITGFTIARQGEIADIESQLETMKAQVVATETNLTSCLGFYDDLLNELDSYTEKRVECEAKLGSRDTEYESRIAELEKQIEDEDSDFSELQDDYDDLAQDAANKICCIEKQLRNSDIDSYSVSGNEIICETDGDNSIDC